MRTCVRDRESVCVFVAPTSNYRLRCGVIELRIQAMGIGPLDKILVQCTRIRIPVPYLEFNEDILERYYRSTISSFITHDFTSW